MWLHSMAGSILGSFFPPSIHTLLSVPFAAPQRVSSALYICLWFSCVTLLADSAKGIVSPRLPVRTLGNRSGQGLFPGAGSERGDGRDAEQRAVPGLGALLGARQAAAVSGRLRSSSGPGVTHGARGGIQQRQGRSSGWKGREREGAGPAVPGRY